MAGYAARLTVLTEENNFAFYPIQIRLELAEKLGEGSSSRRRLWCQIVVSGKQSQLLPDPFKFSQVPSRVGV